MKKKRRRRPVYGKLEKTKHTLKHPLLKRFVPPTRRLNRANTVNMLEKHKVIYIKPDKGKHGNGVFKVEKLSPSRFTYKTGLKRSYFSTFDSMYRSIISKIKQNNYLVQKGINLLHYRGRPYDIRIMIQRNMATRNWHVNGMVGRVAGPNRIITNYYRGKTGGTVKEVETLLAPHMSKPMIAHQKKRLTKIARVVANHFDKKYPSLNEIGLDVVYDYNRKPWFLEVNTTYPSKRLFRLLPDKRMYRRIERFRKQYKI